MTPNELVAPYRTSPSPLQALLCCTSAGGRCRSARWAHGGLRLHRTSDDNIVDQLERSGYVRRVPHDADGAPSSPASRHATRGGRAGPRALNAARFGTEKPLEGGGSRGGVGIPPPAARGKAEGDFDD